MLREISAAGKRERSGALDVEWEGARATFFFMFGHPSHLVFEAADGRKLDGADALDALVDQLPTDFRVAPWRRARVTADTLHCSADDLRGLFQPPAGPDSNGHSAGPHPAGAAAPDGELQPVPEALQPVAPAPPTATEQPQFGFNDFPLLPLGTVLWSDAASNVFNLDSVVPHLRDSLLVLHGQTCQAAALIAGGAIVDAVWVNATVGLLDQEAARALMSSTEGTLTAYRIDDPRLVSALPMLWRAPRLGAALPTAWLYTDDFVAEVRTSGRSCGLLVKSADSGAALFDRGELVAVYTAEHRLPVTSKAALRSLLHAPGALVQVIGQPGPYTAADELADEPSAAAATAAEVTTSPPTPADPVPDTAMQTAPDEAAAADEPTTAEAEMAETDATPPSTVDAKADSGSRRPVDDAIANTDGLALIEPSSNGAGVSMNGASAATATDEPTRADDVLANGEDPQPSSQPASEPVADRAPFEPPVFTIGSRSPERVPELTEMDRVDARQAREFVPPRVDVDIDALRGELTAIAVAWLGADDAAPVASAIGATRPGVDDFVLSIAAIAAMEIPGHETAVVRAMAREMHFRASEVLCGV
jgi:hypothetical protein